MTGKDLLDKANQHIGESYRLGALVPKDNANWRGPWDCAELASWCVFQISNSLYGCDNDHGKPSLADAYTGFWKRDAEAIGQIITVQQAAGIPGAAVLRFPHPGAIGHVVFSDGAGGTVEAHSTKTGVIRGQLANRRWDIGVLVPGITYQAAVAVAAPVAPPIVFRLTDPNMQGPVVRRIQTALQDRHFNPGDIDGDFGPHTMAAVTAFQLDNGLVADGEVGPATAAALGVALS